MANKVEILVEVDPNGRGAAAIRNVGINIDQLGRKSREAGQSGREALDGLAGGLGIPTTIAASTAALGAGIVALGAASLQASNDAARATRVLKSDAQGAGIAFDAARKEAKKFGEDLAISNKEAELSFARFLRVVKGAGELDNLSLYRRRFTDLAAAYALTSTEVETLTSQLLSGQDEALNRLGIADPSQLYRRYAESVGKTVENLTEEEKVRARLLAVIEKGGQFEGVAQQRLTEQTGEWAKLSAAISNATASLGDFLNKRTLIGDIPFLATEGIPALLSNGLPGLTAALAGRSAAQYEAQRKQAQAQAERDINKLLEDQRSRLNVPESLRNPFGSFENRITLLGPEQAAKERENFVAQYESIFKDKRLTATTALFAEEQFNAIRGIFSREKAEEIRGEFTKFWDNYAKTSLKALKTARDAAEDNLGRLTAMAAGDNNPYVKILLDAEERAESLADTFGILGGKVVAEMQAVEAAYTQQKLAALDLDQALKAAALRREARELEGFSGITGAEQRQLSILDAALSRATSVPELLAKAEAIAKGLVELQAGQLDENGRPRPDTGSLQYQLALDNQKIQRQVFDEILAARREFGGGQRAEDRVNQALVEAFNNLAPEMQARIAQGLEGAFQQRTFADAFRGVAEASRRQIEDEIAKARVADEAVRSVQEDISLVRDAIAKGLDPREADARILRITGELSPGEMTADIRQARIEALRREADAESKEREKAEQALADQTAATNNLTASIDRLAGDIKDPKNRRLLIEINNRATGIARTELYGGI